MELLVEDKQHNLNEVIKALSSIRVKVDSMEFTIQDQIAEALRNANIIFEKEVKLSPRNRIDFMVSGGIGIEVKRGKLNSTTVFSQLNRYAGHDIVKEMLLVTERSVDIPPTVHGKPCTTFNLNRLWGIAI